MGVEADLSRPGQAANDRSGLKMHSERDLVECALIDRTLAESAGVSRLRGYTAPGCPEAQRVVAFFATLFPLATEKRI